MTEQLPTQKALFVTLLTSLKVDFAKAFGSNDPTTAEMNAVYNRILEDPTSVPLITTTTVEDVGSHDTVEEEGNGIPGEQVTVEMMWAIVQPGGVCPQGMTRAIAWGMVQQGIKLSGHMPQQTVTNGIHDPVKRRKGCATILEGTVIGKRVQEDPKRKFKYGMTGYEAYECAVAIVDTLTQLSGNKTEFSVVDSSKEQL